uniref:UDP-glucuronosyltransferase n=1 Tax=Lygus hesperus TaxID=30085 RepID=A0A0A9VZX9_LYGHE
MDKYFNYTGWEDRPSILHLLSDQALFLVNSHHSIGYNFPRAPHVKEVGGLKLHEPRPLPKVLKQIMDDAQEGVVYFNLGSNINMAEDLPKEVLDAFIKVFSKLKQKVLWKWAGKNYPPVTSNVYMLDWFPQQDVLAHNNMKLYITHGGQSSTLEAVNYGIPIIGIPFFCDQRRNIRKITTAGFGQLLDLDNLTESSIAWAIDEVLNNERYKQQAIRSQRIFQDRPMKPVEEAVYWIEYVLKHGNILQPASVHMPLYQLLLLDVLGSIAAGIFLIAFIAKKLFRAITTHLGRSKSEKIKQK